MTASKRKKYHNKAVEKWRQRNPEYARRYYLKNKKQTQERCKKWYIKNRRFVLKKGKERISIQRERIAKIKENSPCADCKKFFPAVCMDFDHVKGEKIGAISCLAAKRIFSLVETEIAKCELVCACCHRLRTQKRGYK